jgi:hypothetical protein
MAHREKKSGTEAPLIEKPAGAERRRVHRSSFGMRYKVRESSNIRDKLKFSYRRSLLACVASRCFVRLRILLERLDICPPSVGVATLV